MSKKTGKIQATFLAFLDSFMAAYNIYTAITIDGLVQIMFIGLAIVLICCADYYVKIVLENE